jgi:hypothetical protein
MMQLGLPTTSFKYAIKLEALLEILKLIGTIAGKQVIKLDIAKSVFQLDTVSMRLFGETLSGTNTSANRYSLPERCNSTVAQRYMQHAGFPAIGMAVPSTGTWANARSITRNACES